VKTVMHTLGDDDRLSLVAFSDSARTVLPLTAMSEAGRATAMRALETLRPSGRTNICESFVRVHWVAVPKELRARRVNQQGAGC
jgi:Mg-chelatase subunit ChlD